MDESEVPAKDGSEPLSKEILSNVQTPPLEGALSVSRKRSSPEDDKEGVATEPKTKRRRVEDRGLPSPPPEDDIVAVLDGRPSFDDEPSHLLRRAIALMLEHIGFAGATKEALEELCGEFDSYATKFLSLITASMLSARRSQPIPSDFEYALRHEGLTSRLLKPHLKTEILATKLKPEFLPLLQEEYTYKPATGLLGEELSGESEKRTKPYIPRQFPAFPSKHTYKSTEVKSERETDPRKIREKATEEARHGEEALRRLVKVGKDHRSTSRAGYTATRLHTRHQMWEEAMEELVISNPHARSSSEKEGDEEQSILVNAAKQYGRRPVIRNTALQA